MMNEDYKKGIDRFKELETSLLRDINLYTGTGRARQYAQDLFATQEIIKTLEAKVAPVTNKASSK